MKVDHSNIGAIIDREADVLLSCKSAAAPMPSAAMVAEVMGKVTEVLFYEFAPRCDFAQEHLRRLLYDLYTILVEQISIALRVEGGSDVDARQVSLEVIRNMHEFKRLMRTDVEAIMNNDPAARSAQEVVSSYPAVKAILHYRVAHFLFEAGVPVLPRMITELSHSSTGIDIHPGAVIGEYFGIDHGTGVVVGETCIIGSHVTIYQGVTLGARNFEYDVEGRPMNVPRHPIVEDWVTIYSNTSVLGRVTVGHHTVVGGNIWLTHSVPPHSRLVQSQSCNEKTD